ncbi:hypothetical protein GUITHDRAFT_103150 [Guillardia theta CCMP2712]|uniref:RWP-RK domain-containing protein n=1 Tax=Guillardia theta (strain CCMP2712) TaxID=905079 RepID=L1JS07_GUITC|nr:hypothetical protein GUITHDRAFT_103150 [Guillardia theta CCMP2712]EKX51232.1 hypothetical protein GUITHDRAFT_103150 [Guillardia theta CCMP2712]|mmetsp:Transcript_3353/g.11565  ORF Transcript_3353/g.11565 Transcript_3353/m.11565 type:complete len:191 (-) Transcript_3353:24-596(-)|eukprot:XP_005838212.1 hypothetical protein GUITHDRAFT_103150 [Guillardia theta CCMP2712]
MALFEMCADDCYDLILSHPFRLPLPQAEDPASAPESSTSLQVEEDSALSQDAWTLECSDVEGLGPASLPGDAALHATGCYCKTLSPSPAAVHSELDPDPLSARDRRSCPRSKMCPPVVRVQSRQSFFQSDKPVEITLELLADHFHESLEVAAAKIGIGKSTMKLVCRQLGVDKWPYKFGRAKRKVRPSAK